MNKFSAVICDICRAVITDNPSIEDRLEKIHICNNPECQEIYETISLENLSKAKEYLDSTYYWKELKYIQNRFVKNVLEYKEKLLYREPVDLNSIYKESINLDELEDLKIYSSLIEAE